MHLQWLINNLMLAESRNAVCSNLYAKFGVLFYYSSSDSCVHTDMDAKKWMYFAKETLLLMLTKNEYTFWALPSLFLPLTFSKS